MNILITGASGLIGSMLVEHFVNQGHSIFSLQRNKGPNPSSVWNFQRLIELAPSPSFDAVVHLAGENIATGRWTRKKKKRILESRTRGTEELAAFCANLATRPRVFFCASAIGYYGNRGDTLLDESSSAGDNFVAEVCKKWEEAGRPG